MGSNVVILLICLGIVILTAYVLYRLAWEIEQPWQLDGEWETDGFLIRRKR